jgi:cyclophilin family peptidyl-prolyl cis-trans isomerase
MTKRQRKQVKKNVNTIQILALVVMVVGVAAIVWAISPGSKNALSSGVPTYSTAQGATQDSNATVQPAAATATADPNFTPAPKSSAKQYSSAPAMTIDVKKQYFATFKMAKGGEFIVQLFPDKAPITVNSFVFLAKEGFYNGVTFHRVLEGFMAQGGDPTGTGGGGPGYEFVNEKNDLAFDKPGVVAMANAGPNTNGSQFFIMFGPYGLSESDYTIFGQVTSGMDVVNAITRRDPDQNPSSPGDAITSVTISEK